jgi:aryl-alcohol dehydrogenase
VDRPAYCTTSTELNMRGDRADEASALRLDGTPIKGASSASPASRRMR